MTTERVKIIECSREAWDSYPRRVPMETRANYLRSLVDAGFTHIDAVSFASSAEDAPEMAQRVLEFLDPPEAAEIIGMVVNEEGATRAIQTDAVHTLAFPYSLSPEFLKRTLGQSPDEALETLEKIGTVAYREGLDLVAYISMAFGNPFGDTWHEEETVAACDLLADLGLKQISLIDTAAMAEPRLIASLFSSLLTETAGVEIGAHLRTRPENAAEQIAAAYQAGCRRFDVTLGGTDAAFPGRDLLAGNIATETALAELTRLGAHLPSLRSLDELLTMKREMDRDFGPAPQ